MAPDGREVILFRGKGDIATNIIHNNIDAPFATKVQRICMVGLRMLHFVQQAKTLAVAILFAPVLLQKNFPHPTRLSCFSYLIIMKNNRFLNTFESPSVWNISRQSFFFFFVNRHTSNFKTRGSCKNVTMVNRTTIQLTKTTSSISVSLWVKKKKKVNIFPMCYGMLPHLWKTSAYSVQYDTQKIHQIEDYLKKTIIDFCVSVLAQLEVLYSATEKSPLVHLLNKHEKRK